MTDSKENCIKSYDKQGYRLQEIGLNQDKPKELLLKNWNTLPSNTNIGKENMFAVIQEDNKITFDFDLKNDDLTKILNDYLDKTLVIQTGNGGRHYYFKDIPRANQIRTATLYKNDKPVGDIRAHMSYVIGCGSSYNQDGKTKSYTKISSVDQVLEMDCEIILKILKDNGITTTITGKISDYPKRNFKNGVREGERNTECFKTTCNLFEKEKLDFDSGLAFMKTWNRMSKKPLAESEVITTVKSAWNRINNKQLDFEGKDKIDNIVIELRKDNNFKTPRKTEKILLYTGKIYDNMQAETIIKEKTEALILNCTTNNTLETIEKIKRQTYVNMEDFDKDPNLNTLLNGILNFEEERLMAHTPNNLSQVLLPLEYHKPKYEIKEKTIFADIEKNLKDTLFYQFLTRSFTVDGKFKRKNFESVLEIIASVFIKRQIDQKAFMFLGGGENGKSVLLEYIESMLGQNSINVTHIPLQDMAEDKFVNADLDGVSLNIFSDLEENGMKKSGKVKNIISGEGLQVQKKYGQPFTLYPFCKLLFSCNRFPKVFDQSQGFFRRWIIVKWERSFENDPERISDLKYRLMENQEEKNKVFSALVPLANKLNRTGEFSHKKDWKDTQKEWNENADPLDSFINNYIIEDIQEKARKTKIETYQFYKQTMFELGEIPLSIGKFGREFAEIFDEDKSGGVRYWLHIDFRIPKIEKFKEVDKE